MLRSWIEQPLILPDEIAARQDAVEYFLNDPFRRDTLREALERVSSIRFLPSVESRAWSAAERSACGRATTAVGASTPPFFWAYT